MSDNFFDCTISSRTNPTVAAAAKLADKKGRELSRLFLCEGIKLFLEAVKAGALMENIFIKKSEAQNIVNMLKDEIIKARSSGASVILLSDEAFSKISTEMSPQGIIASVKYMTAHKTVSGSSVNYDPSERIIIFESMRDPGNVGAVLRSAAAFGFQRIIFSSDSADIYNPKAVRSSMGAIFRMNIDIYENLKDAVEALENSGRRVIAAVVNSSAKSITEIELRSSDCFMIGNEGHGLSSDIIDSCTDGAFIPISSDTESLNASVAASVIMWEMSRADSRKHTS